MRALSDTKAVNDAIAAARGLPGLIARFRAIDPAYALQLQGKVLWRSRSPAGTLLVAVLAWASARYGFGWNADTVNLVAAAGVLAGGYAMRLLTRQPIVGLLRVPQGTPPTIEPDGTPSVLPVGTPSPPTPAAGS